MDYIVDVWDIGFGVSVIVFGVNLMDGSLFKGVKLVVVVGFINLIFVFEFISFIFGVYVIFIYVSDLGEYSFRILSCKLDDVCNVISNVVYVFNVGGVFFVF